VILKPRSAGNTRSNSKGSSKPSSKAADTKPASCDILCQLDKDAKELWERLSGEKGGNIEDALKGGLDARKLGVIG